MTIHPQKCRCSQSFRDQVWDLRNAHRERGEVEVGEANQLLGQCLADARATRNIYEEAKLVGFIVAQGPAGPIRVYFAFMEMWEESDYTTETLRQARDLHKEVTQTPAPLH